MNLVDRYLRAVKEHLPRKQQDDVIAELAANLRAQMEDEEEARGRPLAETEQAAILRRFGNPIVVAARYRGDSRSFSFGRQLIGPELFPTYQKVLAINAVITALVMVAVVLVGGGTLWSSVYGGLVPIVLQFGIVTAVFIVIHNKFAADPDRWDPFTVGFPDADTGSQGLDRTSALAMRPARPTTVSHTTSLAELGLSMITLAVWLSIGTPQTIGFLGPGPGWADLHLPVTALLVAVVMGPFVTLLRPSLVRFRLASRAFYDGVGIAILATSLAIGQWVVPSASVAATPSLLELVGHVNAAVRISIAVAIVIMAVSLVQEVRRFRRLQESRP